MLPPPHEFHPLGDLRYIFNLLEFPIGRNTVDQI
jgi:hypothetical protein